MKEFNKYIYGDLHNQKWAIDSAKLFYRSIYKLSNNLHCKKCHELWPSIKDECETCLKDKDGKWTEDNMMVPNLDRLPPDMQKSFEDLTMIEEQLISPVSAIMTIFRLSGGQLFNRGYSASFTKDLGPLCRSLPRLSKDVSIVIIKKLDNNNNNKEFKVNRHRVEKVLRYLCHHNDLWKTHGISISEANLDSLPNDGIPEDLNFVIETSDSISSCPTNGPVLLENNIEEPEFSDNHVYIEADQIGLKECDKIKSHFNYPRLSSRPVNEYEYPGIISLVFPKLFPNCYGDPTIKDRLFHVSETDTYRHLIKYACRRAYSEELYYPFAEHPRFMFYVQDRLVRHRTLDQSKIYLKNNSQDANLSVKELKDAIKNNNGKSFISKNTIYKFKTYIYHLKFA